MRFNYPREITQTSVPPKVNAKGGQTTGYFRRVWKYTVKIANDEIWCQLLNDTSCSYEQVIRIPDRATTESYLVK